MNKVRFSTDNFKAVEEIANGRYYLRSIILEEEGTILASEAALDHYPTADEISKSNADALAEKTKIQHENTLNHIDELKRQLSDSDYKVTKNSEWAAAYYTDNGNWPSINDEGWPYAPKPLHTERQAIRDEINEYENNENSSSNQ